MYLSRLLFVAAKSVLWAQWQNAGSWVFLGLHFRLPFSLQELTFLSPWLPLALPCLPQPVAPMKPNCPLAQELSHALYLSHQTCCSSFAFSQPGPTYSLPNLTQPSTVTVVFSGQPSSSLEHLNNLDLFLTTGLPFYCFGRVPCISLPAWSSQRITSEIFAHSESEVLETFLSLSCHQEPRVPWVCL